MSNKGQVTILTRPIPYKGFIVIAQNIGNLFQAFMFRKENNEVYQVHNYIDYPDHRKRWTQKELENAATFITNQAFTTIELLLGNTTQEEIDKEVDNLSDEKKELFKGIMEVADANDKKNSQKETN